MDLNINHTEIEQDGWSIMVDKTPICLTCVLEAGEDVDMGTTINYDDRMIHISNIAIVPSEECEYVSEHDSSEIAQALASLVAQGKVEKVYEDGQVKYRAI